MKRTKCTGQNCVGDLRLAPIDIGFDLRESDTPVVLPAEFESVGLEQDGDIWLVEGDWREMVQAMLDAGYHLAV